MLMLLRLLQKTSTCQTSAHALHRHHKTPTKNHIDPFNGQRNCTLRPLINIADIFGILLTYMSLIRAYTCSHCLAAYRAKPVVPVLRDRCSCIIYNHVG